MAPTAATFSNLVGITVRIFPESPGSPESRSHRNSKNLRRKVAVAPTAATFSNLVGITIRIFSESPGSPDSPASPNSRRGRKKWLRCPPQPLFDEAFLNSVTPVPEPPGSPDHQNLNQLGDVGPGLHRDRRNHKRVCFFYPAGPESPGFFFFHPAGFT